jgi:ribose/xylose/arabinose/galactoside ABC-type transport system permease subunit
VKVGVLVASGVAGALGRPLYVGQYHGTRFDLGPTDLLTIIAAAIIAAVVLSARGGSRG